MRPLIAPALGLCLLAALQAPAQSGRTATQPAGKAVTAAPSVTAPGKSATTQAPSLLSWAVNMMRDGERKDLPYIHEVKALGAGTIGFTAYLTEAQYTELSSAELAALPGLGTVPAEVQLHWDLGYQRKLPVALVDIYPYRRNPATGGAERLVSYQLQVVEERGGVHGHSKSATYPDHSKLASGDWFRFTVPEDGVYKLSYSFLQQLGVNMSGLASDQINIYGNHEGLLPFQNSPARPNDLLQNAIYVQDGGDGQFGPDDYILFYASGAQRWDLNAAKTRFVHTKNVYTDSASYFVGIGVDPPKRIATVAQSTNAATDQVTAFNDHQFIDRDNVNMLKSGRIFFGEVYDLVTTYNYSFTLPYLHTSDSLFLTSQVMARTINNLTSSFRIQVGSADNTFSVPGVSGANEAAYGILKNVTTGFTASQTVLPITVTFIKNDPITSLGYMDYLELNARRDLKMAGDQLLFRDLVSVGTGHVAEYTVDQASGVQAIWEVTDPINVGSIAYTDNGAQKVFRLAADSLREFVAFRGQNFPEPKAIGRVTNQDLHATTLPTDLVIVCPQQYLSEAQRLAERRASEGLSVVMVTPQQVFNEFSSGQRDATAIKRYMKMLYDRAGADPNLLPRYLLLFGDGSYNNIDLAASNQNLIPTYQSADALRPAYCYTADDYYGLLDDNEGEASNDLVDIGIGRLPVSDGTQAREAVDKLLNYDKLNLNTATASTCTSGNDGGANDWRDLVLFCADDQDGGGEGIEPTHTLNSEFLANKVETEHPCLNENKIYLDAYVQYSTPGGERYPDASDELRDRVQKGCLLVNYVGHGGEVGWAHERFLDNTTILGWTNLDRLPLFMTATCEFSRWDDPSRTSAGEYVFLNPNGGGIGLMTTTRIAYSGQNQVLSIDFYDHALDATDEMGRAQRLGDIYRRTKVAATPADPNAQPNHRNFTLLGDPSLRLAMARNEARITAITDTLGNVRDTLRALDVIKVRGEVLDANGVLDANFNGTVIPTVFDKKETVTTLANDPPAQPLTFSLRKGIIYRGRATVTNGVFTFTFVVPKDINYQVGPGRIGVYAESFNTNACGYTNDPLVGGTNPNALADAVGPKIELYLNDDRFVPGGITTESPLIYAKLSDDNGINTLGNSIGHDLVAVLDGDAENGIVLNDVYQADKDSYKSGEVRYRLSNLSEGHHTLDLKAWDVYNNSSQKSTEFVVAPSAELALAHVLNYPNPFTTHTEFYFEHNRPCQTLDCQVQVFTVAGRLVKTLNRKLDCDGFRSEPMAWDGLDDYGDKLGRGVYVYRLSITTATGEEADKFEKLVILR